jgi:hypothetical protein
MSNWKEKRKQKRANTARAAQDKLDSLYKALKRINLLSMDIEDAYITRGARDPEDVDVLIQIVEINHEIMEACNGALWEASRGHDAATNPAEGWSRAPKEPWGSADDDQVNASVGLPALPPGTITITLKGDMPVN